MWGERVFFSLCGYVTLANTHYLHIQMCYGQSNMFQQLLNVHLHYYSSKRNLNNLYADIWPKLTKPQCCHHGDWLMQLHLPSVQSRFIMLMLTLLLCASCDRDGCVQKAASSLAEVPYGCPGEAVIDRAVSEWWRLTVIFVAWSDQQLLLLRWMSVSLWNCSNLFECLGILGYEIIPLTVWMWDAKHKL